MPTYLRIDGVHFRDENNREVTLRGINCASNAKNPSRPESNSHTFDNFFDGDNVSFVGRPFTVEDADRNFSRLKSWGYNTLRYIFTWEAIESRGPGIYDEEWIESTIDVLRVAQKYGFMIFMDPHQDVWSRFSGGSGAPMWTLYAMGLNPRAFAETEAAMVQNTYPDPENYPKMIWATNYTRLACFTAFTMFFGGRHFTPKCIINGMNIQDFLEHHYFSAIKHLAQKIHDAGGLEDVTVIGWESFNEPNRGLIGYHALDKIPTEQKLQKGTSPTAWQAILLGSGRKQTVEVWDVGGMGPYKSGTTEVDPHGTIAWLPANYDDSRYGWTRDPGWKLGKCIWAQHGIWDPATDTILRNDYFATTRDGKPLDAYQFANVYFMDHFRKYSEVIRSVHKNAIMFCQPPVLEIPPIIKGTKDADPRLVYAPHFYDGITLMVKKWNRVWNVDVLGVLRGRYWSPAFAIKLGETAIRNCIRDQLKAIKQEGLDNIGDVPCLFSEIGAPYDMDDKYAYKTGDYISQIRALDANHFALEGAGVGGYTLWTYCPTNEHKWGDQWNGEDFSIYSVDDNLIGESTPASPANASQLDMPSKKGPQDNFETHASAIARSNSGSSLSSMAKSVIDVAGSRAAEAVIRPSPFFTHGTLISSGFNLAKATFSMKLDAPSPTPEAAPTEIFVPPYHFPLDTMQVTVSSGKWEYDYENRLLRWTHDAGEQTITIVGEKRANLVAAESGIARCCPPASCSIM